MSELINFRDFGGYQTEDGRHVKQGIFFRSGSYRDLTETDREYIRSLNIQNLLDYREVNELESDEKRHEFSKKVYNISASAHLPSTDENSELDDPYSVMTTDDMVLFYEMLVFDNPGYINAFKVLSEPNAVPYLHNCTAGKDRTGVGSALILLALGVDEATVMADYLQSMDAYDAIVQNEIRRLSERKSIESLYHKIPGLIVKPAYLKAAFKTIKSKYGDYATYFEKEFGLDAPAIEALRHNYTE